MAKYKPREHKLISTGETVILYQDTSSAWFVGAGSDTTPPAIPFGAFASQAAARQWADRHFPGGEWQRRPSPARGG